MGARTYLNTYLTVGDPQAMQQALDRFQRVLQRIGYRDPLLSELSRSHDWEELERGDFGLLLPQQAVVSFDRALWVQPLVMSVSSAWYPKLGAPLLEFNLDFDEASVYDWQTEQYRRGWEGALWRLTSIVAEAFEESGACLSCDGCESDQWRCLLAGDAAARLWSFDLAVVLPSLAAAYSPLPSSHCKAIVAGRIALARKSAWGVKPWEA